jgi:predicted O-methyltransferase YrrM
MNNQLGQLLAELEHFGNANDGATNERSQKMLNITRETGEFMAVLVRATVARRVLEIGTSNGYSTLWLAEAARAVGGTLTPVACSNARRIRPLTSYSLIRSALNILAGGRI